MLESKGHFFLFKDLVGVVIRELLGIEWQGQGPVGNTSNGSIKVT
jgi:hypothetical protein